MWIDLHMINPGRPAGGVHLPAGRNQSANLLQHDRRDLPQWKYGTDYCCLVNPNSLSFHFFLFINFSWEFNIRHTLYTLRKPLQHLLATGVPSCEEPGSAHEQTCKISREELPHPIKQRRDELRKRYFFVSLPLCWRLLILVDSCAEWGWPDTLQTIQGALWSTLHRPYVCLYVPKSKCQIRPTGKSFCLLLK